MARRSLLFNSAVYIVGQFLSKALGFVLLIIYARFLLPEDFGITGTLSAYAAVLSTVFVLGLHGSVGRHYFELKHDPQKLRGYLSSVYLFQVLFSLVIVLALELWGGWAWRRFTPDSIPFSYVRLALWATFFNTLTLIPQALFQSEERSTIVVGWQIAQGVMAVAIGVVLVGVLHQHALGVLRSQLISSAALALVFFFLFARNWGSRQLALGSLKKALLFGLPLLPHTIGSILMQTVDRIMLEKYAPLAEVGLYSIAMTLGLILAMVAGGINQAWSPHFFRTSSEEDPAVARKKAETFASLFVAMFAGLSLLGALLAPELTRIFLGAKYLPAVPYLIPFVIGNLFGIFYFLPANQLFLFSKTAWFLIATGIATALSVGLNLWFLPRGGGAMAAAWIFVAGSICQFVIVAIAARIYQAPLIGARHWFVLVASLAALGAATHELGLPARLSMLAAIALAIYVLLVRGNLREVFPRGSVQP